MTAVEGTCSSSVPRVEVGFLVLDDADKVLLTLRKRVPEAGRWSIVGDKVEYRGRLEDTARREASEGTGELVRLLCVTDPILPDADWVAPAYLARSMGGTLHNAETKRPAELQFFSLKELLETLTLTAQNALTALRTKR